MRRRPIRKLWRRARLFQASEPVPAENLGENAFVGTVTQGGETHIGLGALHGTLIVGATLAGYDPTPENTAKLISLTREEERAAKAAIGSKPTEIVRCGFKYVLPISLASFSLFPFAQNEITRLS